jgi:hypothetical protein
MDIDLLNVIPLTVRGRRVNNPLTMRYAPSEEGILLEEKTMDGLIEQTLSPNTKEEEHT